MHGYNRNHKGPRRLDCQAASSGTVPVATERQAATAALPTVGQTPRPCTRSYGYSGGCGPGAIFVVGLKLSEAAGSSGNTFAVIAFRLAQDRPVVMAHHLHAAAQIRKVSRGLPTVALIRHPREVAASRVTRHAPITMAEALIEWVDFYETVDECRGGVAVVPFELLTRDFGNVVDMINDRFGTNYTRFDHSAANVELVFQITDELYRRRNYGHLETAVARPVSSRAQERDLLGTGSYGWKRL